VAGINNHPCKSKDHLQSCESCTYIEKLPQKVNRGGLHPLPCLCIFQCLFSLVHTSQIPESWHSNKPNCVWTSCWKTFHVSSMLPHLEYMSTKLLPKNILDSKPQWMIELDSTLQWMILVCEHAFSLPLCCCPNGLTSHLNQHNAQGLTIPYSIAANSASAQEEWKWVLCGSQNLLITSGSTLFENCQSHRTFSSGSFLFSKSKQPFVSGFLKFSWENEQFRVSRFLHLILWFFWSPVKDQNQFYDFWETLVKGHNSELVFENHLSKVYAYPTLTRRFFLPGS
jgi:hypothetical protein